MYYPCSENKGADQLRGYREADLRLCFRICKKPVFSRRGSYNRGVHVVVLGYGPVNAVNSEGVGQLARLATNTICVFVVCIQAQSRFSYDNSQLLKSARSGSSYFKTAKIDST